ncbi:MAG: YfhO family protein [Armatimonadota bacterium]
MRPGGKRNTIRRLLSYAIFLGLVCVFLWRPIFNGEALLPGDYLAQMSPWNTELSPSSPPPQWNPLQWDAIAQFYPWRVFYARSMRAGVIPIWNPYQLRGTPFLANGQSAVLYPPNLVFLILDPVTAFTVYAALHLFLAAAFMYLLMRELGCTESGGIAGGICFAFCAFMVLWLELPTFIGAAVWLPLVLLLVHKAVERRSVFYGMLAGMTQAMAFLAGHFQIAFYVAMAAGLWWLWKLGEVWRTDGKTYAVLGVVLPFLGFALTAGLIAAPQVLPTVELAQSSHRVRDVTAAGYDRFVSNGVPPYRLITAFISDFFGNPSRNDYFLGSAADYMEYGLYVGIMPLMLALIAVFNLRSIRYAGFFALLAVLALLTATGTPINYLFYYAIPGFSALGGPNRILMVYFVGIAGLAAFGMDWFTENASRRATWRRHEYRAGLMAGPLAFGIVCAALAGAYLCAIPMLRCLPSPSGPPVGTVFAAFLAASAGVIVARACDVIRSSVFLGISIVLIVADLFAFGINYNPSCDRSKIYPETELTRKLKQIAGTSRIAPVNPRWSLYRTPDAILPPNGAMVYELYDVQGYDSLYTRAYKDLSSAIQGEDSSPPENGNMVLIKRVTPQLPQIARYFLTREPFTDAEPRTRLIGRWDGVYVYELLDGVRDCEFHIPSPYFSFRLGLFLGCVGVGAVAGAGSYRAVRRRRSRA